MRKRMNGYFTVEAALVLPIVLFCIIVVMYLLIFQYNRCLMEQDAGTIALRGATMQMKNSQDRVDQLRQQANDVTGGKAGEKYIAWSNEVPSLRVEKGRVRVTQSGKSRFLLPLGLSDVKVVRDTEVEYENHILSPVSFIRNMRKLKGE